jgi:hypothetical protein
LGHLQRAHVTQPCPLERGTLKCGVGKESGEGGYWEKDAAFRYNYKRLALPRAPLRAETQQPRRRPLPSRRRLL